MPAIFIAKKARKTLKALDRKTQKLIDGKIVSLADDYSAYSSLLAANLTGLRSAHAGPYRIMFAVCEECHQNGWKHLNEPRCGCCKDIPEKAIHIIKIGPRRDVYKIKRDSGLKAGKKKKNRN